MREPIKSMMSITWGMSLFAMKQMSLFTDPARVGDNLQSLASAIEGELDEGLRQTYQAGDRLQRQFVNLAFGSVGMAGGAPPPAQAAAGAAGPSPGAPAASTPVAGPGIGPAPPPPVQAAPGWGPVPPLDREV